ncbi:uncharacterized protein BJX67DRAFT_340530 [Aspergillus lucknowensis]|uniref:Uncharacterized protein n=1 Tax=Aspergillus lucknowensis TaxID=176173 RepID=A0ABR4M8A2_9EURO
MRWWCRRRWLPRARCATRWPRTPSWCRRRRGSLLPSARRPTCRRARPSGCPARRWMSLIR